MLFLAELLNYYIGHYTFRLFDYKLKEERMKEIEEFIDSTSKPSKLKKQKKFLKGKGGEAPIIIIDKFDLKKIQKIVDENYSDLKNVEGDLLKKDKRIIGKFIVYCKKVDKVSDSEVEHDMEKYKLIGEVFNDDIPESGITEI